MISYLYSEKSSDRAEKDTLDLPVLLRYNINIETNSTQHSIIDTSGNDAGRVISYSLRDGIDVFLINTCNIPELALHASGREPGVIRFFQASHISATSQPTFSFIGQLSIKPGGGTHSFEFSSTYESLHGMVIERIFSRFQYRVVKSTKELAYFTLCASRIEISIDAALNACSKTIVLGLAYSIAKLLPET
jgi:hypothetical protein